MYQLSIEEKMPSHFYFDILLKDIESLPIWVKQAIFVELRDHLNKETPFDSLETISKQNLIQLFRPNLSMTGIKTINDGSIHSYGCDFEQTEDMLVFMQEVTKKPRIIDICQTLEWKLSKCCRALVDCIQYNLIEPIYSDFISSTVYFLANKIRIGEYLVRTGKITVEQLDMALYSQKYTEQTLGDRIYLAQILVNLRYISPNDYENILFLKEFGEEIYSKNLNNNISGVQDNVEKLKKELLSLRDERSNLRENLSKFSDDVQTIASLLNQIDCLKNELGKVEKEKNKIKTELNLYLDELVNTAKENNELREKLDNE